MHSVNISRVKHLNSIAGIFTAELYAVFLAVDYIRLKRKERSIIFVDSQSVITAVISLKDTRITLEQLVRAMIITELQKWNLLPETIIQSANFVEALERYLIR